MDELHIISELLKQRSIFSVFFFFQEKKRQHDPTGTKLIYI